MTNHIPNTPLHDTAGRKPPFRMTALDHLDALSKDPRLAQVHLAVLGSVTHYPRTVTVRTGRGATTVTLERFAFPYQRTTAARFHVPPNVFRRNLGKLEELGIVRIEPGRHYSMVTLTDINNPTANQHQEKPREISTGSEARTPRLPQPTTQPPQELSTQAPNQPGSQRVDITDPSTPNLHPSCQPSDDPRTPYLEPRSEDLEKRFNQTLSLSNSTCNLPTEERHVSDTEEPERDVCRSSRIQPPQKRHPIDPDFPLTPDLRAYAEQVDVHDPEKAIDEFRLKHLAEGTSRADWIAEAKLWFRRRPDVKPDYHLSKLRDAEELFSPDPSTEDEFFAEVLAASQRATPPAWSHEAIHNAIDDMGGYEVVFRHLQTPAHNETEQEQETRYAVARDAFVNALRSIRVHDLDVPF